MTLPLRLVIIATFVVSATLALIFSSLFKYGCCLCAIHSKTTRQETPTLHSAQREAITTSPPHWYQTVDPIVPTIPPNAPYASNIVLTAGNSCGLGVTPIIMSRILLYHPSKR